MVRGKEKSGTYKRVMRRTPGGKSVLRFLRRNPAKAQCGKCAADLAGVPRKRPRELSRLARTQRRPQRMFGGVLCTKCSRREIITKSRSQ
ncbi:50S ribosomal protein L34e [Candidatus Woesearchaeota archaeon]|nr:50S ribosomal protein L34e [Candidatus Woesearchaeota archaeon]